MNEGINKDSTNVLIIGKSGVGKSSLLNYMFGRELQKVVEILDARLERFMRLAAEPVGVGVFLRPLRSAVADRPVLFIRDKQQSERGIIDCRIAELRKLCVIIRHGADAGDAEIGIRRSNAVADRKPVYARIVLFEDCFSRL